MASASHEPDPDRDELRRRLDEAEETLRAIRCGEVDALVVEGAGGAQVFTLQGADHPYRALIESMQQGAVSLSGDGTVLFCNRCFAEMVKVPLEKAIGASLTEFLPPAHRPTFEALLQEGRTNGSQAEVQFLTAEGTLLPVYLALAPLPLSDSEAISLVVTDLTGQKKHQDLLDADRRKDEFLAMLAHELRNPLAPIRNALHLLDGPDADGAVGDEIRAMMRRQVEHMTRLVDDLLDVSRITQGKVELRKKEVDLALVVNRSVEASRPHFEAKGHLLTIAIPPEPIRLLADPTRLEQIFDNLLTNAAKYSDHGGHIRLNVARQGAQVEIVVADAGIGIAPDDLSHIFDLFMQAERRLDRSQGGLGIGLSLVRSLVELHGGTVAAHSEGRGRGSEFVVRLPVLDAAPRNLDQEPPVALGAVARPLPRRRILVVDDNLDSARTMALLLKRLWGQEVEVAHDGERAVNMAHSFRPDVILLDIGLPGMSGYEVAKCLRQRPESARSIIIAMTGWGHDDDRRRSREAGIDHHLVKPVDPDDLQRLLARHAANGDP